MHVDDAVHPVSVHLLHQNIEQAKTGVYPQNLVFPHHVRQSERVAYRIYTNPGHAEGLDATKS